MFYFCTYYHKQYTDSLWSVDHPLISNPLHDFLLVSEGNFKKDLLHVGACNSPFSEIWLNFIKKKHFAFSNI